MESSDEDLICRLNIIIKRLVLLKVELTSKMLGKNEEIKFLINYDLLIKNET